VKSISPSIPNRIEGEVAGETCDASLPGRHGMFCAF
jgi:hypothetical protein